MAEPTCLRRPACEFVRKVDACPLRPGRRPAGALGACLLPVALILLLPAPALAAEGSLASAVAPVVNFAVLVGVLYYVARRPVAAYFAERHAGIRRDLAEAAALKAEATARLAEVARRMEALPGEIEALRRRGREEIAAEEARIAAAAAAERERLVQQARRAIDLQLRLARRELLEHAATLAVQRAAERVRREIAPEDHERLVARYLDQVGRVRG